MKKSATKSAYVHRHLSNGMEVYLHEQHFSPVFTIYICVKAGSQDETVVEQGMAHVLEHMLFKGTKHFPVPGELARTVETAGGDINAYTTFDRTVYELSAPAHFALQGASLLLDMVQNAVLEAGEHQRETEVIVEEIRRGNDSPGSRLSKALFRQTFANTELGRPIIGTVESVRSFTQKNVEDFYKRWYLPNNMILVAAGDFDAQAFYEHLEKHAQNFAPGNVPARVRPLVKSIGEAGPQIEVITGAFQEVRLQLAVRAPCLEDDSLARWDAFASLLGQGDSSRLSHEVKDAAGLATGVEAGVYSPKYPAGIATIGLYARGETVLKALEKSLECVRQLAKEEPSETELKRVLTTLKAERIYARETVEGVVRQTLAQLLTTYGINFEEHYLQSLSRVTPKCVQTTAAEFLRLVNQGACAVCAVAAEEHKHLLEDAAIADVLANTSLTGNRAAPRKTLQGDTATSGQPVHTKRLRFSELNPEVKQLIFETTHGTRININYRRTQKIPAVSFGLYAQGGQLLEQAKSQKFPPGTASLMSQMLTRGTQRLTYRDFVTDLENRAATLQSFQGRDLFGIRGDCLIEDFEPVLKLGFDCVFLPGMQDAEYKRVLRESIDMLRAQKDNPFSRLSRIAGPLLYGSHPYALPLSGTEEALEAIDLGLVCNLWRKQILARNWFFSIAGDFDEEMLEDLVAELFDNATRQVQGREVLSSESYEQNSGHAEVSAEVNPLPQVAFEAFDREQAHILLGFRGARMADPERTALEIASTILSGQGGRLFADLRETKSLAYSVSCSQSLNLLGGHFMAYIGTSADKAETAFYGLKENIEELASQAPSELEMTRAKQALLGSQAMDAQQLSYQCSQLAYSDAFGLGFDNFLKFKDRIESVDAQAVQQVLKDKLANNPPVVAVIGQTGTWIPEHNGLAWKL